MHITVFGVLVAIFESMQVLQLLVISLPMARSKKKIRLGTLDYY